MAAQNQPDTPSTSQCGATPVESSPGESPSKPTGPWYMKVLSCVFSQSTVNALWVGRKLILGLGVLALMDSTTITSSGFSSAMTWWRVVFLGLVYISYHGAAFLAQFVAVLAFNMEGLQELSERMPPEGKELMKTLMVSPPRFAPDGTLLHMPTIMNHSALPELTPEMEEDALAVTHDMVKNTMLSYKKIRSGDRNPFSHWFPEPIQKAVVEEIFDDDEAISVEVARSNSNSSFEDLGRLQQIGSVENLEETEEIDASVPRRKDI